MRQTLIAALPGAGVKVFEGLGHNPFWEDPEGVAAAINGFLGAKLGHGAGSAHPGGDGRAPR